MKHIFGWLFIFRYNERIVEYNKSVYTILNTEMKESANIWQLFKMSLQHVAIYWILNAESFLDQNCLDLVNVGGSEINWSDSTIIAVEILRLISRKLIL